MGRASNKLGGDLKALIRQTLKEKRVTPPLDLEKTTLEEGGLLRSSALASICAREEVLCARTKRTRSEEHSADTIMIFEHGNGLHWDLQNRILPKIEIMRGRWLCIGCGAISGGGDTGEWPSPPPIEFVDAQVRRAAHCPACGTEWSSASCLYEEQLFINREFRISCHPDGFLVLGDFDGLGVLEGKSINPKGAWEVRGCPKLDHVVQTQCNMWLTGLQWGKILYWDKAGAGMSALIEHTVRYDEDHVTAIKTLITDVWEGVAGGPLPEPICAHQECKRASYCSMPEECFGEGL